MKKFAYFGAGVVAGVYIFGKVLEVFARGQNPQNW